MEGDMPSGKGRFDLRKFVLNRPLLAKFGIPFALVVTFRWKRLPYWIDRLWKQSGIFMEEWELGMCSLFPQRVLTEVLSRYSPKSALDVGCGTGLSLDWFLAHGVEGVGIEGSPIAIKQAKNPARILECDLQEPLDLKREFDLVWSFEVAEHIKPSKARNFVQTLTRHGNRIVVSAAPPGQMGAGHVNLKPLAYWEDLFGEAGFRLNLPDTTALRSIPDKHAENLMVFERIPNSGKSL